MAKAVFDAFPCRLEADEFIALSAAALMINSACPTALNSCRLAMLVAPNRGWVASVIFSSLKELLLNVGRHKAVASFLSDRRAFGCMVDAV